MDIKEEKRDIFNGDNAICPECGETLTPADLETYARCPYCDHQFERDARFDDFIVAPLVGAGLAGLAYKCLAGCCKSCKKD